MAWTTTDYTFKKILNKRSTDNNKRTSEEIGDYTLNVHFSEIWGEHLPWPPPASTTSVVQVYDKLELTKDVSVANGQAWFATSDASPPYVSANRLRKWVSDKFDEDNLNTYSIRLFFGDPGSTLNDVEIYFNDPSTWIFDYQTGILTFQSSTLASGAHTYDSGKVFKVSGYRYVGLMGAGTGSTTPIDGVGTANYLSVFTDNNTLTDSIAYQISGATIDGSTILQVDGVLRATSKSFDIPHPNKEGYRLVYGCLEGPENGAYHRGRVQGNGTVFVELPDYWQNLVKSYTVHLTAYGNYSIYVASQSQKGFEVARCGGFLSRNKSIDFSFVAVGERLDAPLITEYKARPNLSKL